LICFGFPKHFLICFGWNQNIFWFVWKKSLISVVKTETFSSWGFHWRDINSCPRALSCCGWKIEMRDLYHWASIKCFRSIMFKDCYICTSNLPSFWEQINAEVISDKQFCNDARDWFWFQRTIKLLQKTHFFKFRMKQKVFILL
jgi:hypothetical protein